MKITSIRVFMALVGLFLLLSMTNVQAQQGNPLITSTPILTINENLCPPDNHCGRLWRMSRNDERQYLFTVYDRVFHAIEPDGTITTYDNVPVRSTIDFVPYDASHIVVLDTAAYTLSMVNIETGEQQEIIPEHRFRTCLPVYYPPPRDLTWVGDSDWLVTCGFGSSSGMAFNISVVNVVTGELREITGMRNTGPPTTEWNRVIGGHDNAVYIQAAPSGPLTTSLVPESPEPMYFTLRYDLGDGSWDVITTPVAEADAAGIHSTTIFPYLMSQLIGVDAASNLYFYDRPQYIKLNAQGEILWVLDENDFGFSPFPVDVTAEGDLILTPSGPEYNNTTVGVQLVETEVNWPPDTDAEPVQPLTVEPPTVAAPSSTRPEN